MFRVSNNIGKTITKKKKLLFISTISSNKTSLFNEPKLFEEEKKDFKITSKSSSSISPLKSQKSKNKTFDNQNNNFVYNKILPKKRILFHLYHIDLMNQKKGKNKIKSKIKKENINIQKNKGIFNCKYKKKNLATKKNIIAHNNKNYSVGRWKIDEHKRFIDAIIKFGNNWRQVQKYVGTRSSIQTRSHAQKFFEKLKRSKIFKRGKYDFSKNSLKILHDIMKNLPEKEYNLTLKHLQSLSYERKSNSDNDKNIIENNNDIINSIGNSVENNENNMEKINYDGNSNNYFVYEDNLKYLKSLNQGYSFLDINNNNKLYNTENFLLYNNINNCNINNSNYLNYDINSYDRKESDIFSQRKNSLNDFILDTKDVKEQNNNEELNLDYNISYNNSDLISQQDNKINANKLFDFNEDKLSYTKQFNNKDFFFNQETSRKMSLEEKLFIN